MKENKIKVTIVIRNFEFENVSPEERSVTIICKENYVDRIFSYFVNSNIEEIIIEDFYETIQG